VNAVALPSARMDVTQFIDWAVAQPRGRFELVDGEVVAMAPERVRHNLVKFSVASALDAAVRRAGLSCTVFTDGVTVVIDEHTAREPDAAIQCGSKLDLEATVLDEPMVVVEVTSPSSDRDDTGAKLVEYFCVPSIRHYLIVRPDKDVVVHHRRDESGGIQTAIVKDGAIAMQPPGIEVRVAALLRRELDMTKEVDR
jgi:Uma2 family endonuclease